MYAADSAGVILRSHSARSLSIKLVRANRSLLDFSAVNRLASICCGVGDGPKSSFVILFISDLVVPAPCVARVEFHLLKPKAAAGLGDLGICRIGLARVDPCLAVLHAQRWRHGTRGAHGGDQRHHVRPLWAAHQLASLGARHRLGHDALNASRHLGECTARATVLHIHIATQHDDCALLWAYVARVSSVQHGQLKRVARTSNPVISRPWVVQTTQVRLVDVGSKAYLRLRNSACHRQVEIDPPLDPWIGTWLG